MKIHAPSRLGLRGEVGPGAVVRRSAGGGRAGPVGPRKSRARAVVRALLAPNGELNPESTSSAFDMIVRGQEWPAGVEPKTRLGGVWASSTAGCVRGTERDPTLDGGRGEMGKGELQVGSPTFAKVVAERCRVRLVRLEQAPTGRVLPNIDVRLHAPCNPTSATFSRV